MQFLVLIKNELVKLRRQVLSDLPVLISTQEPLIVFSSPVLLWRGSAWWAPDSQPMSIHPNALHSSFMTLTFLRVICLPQFVGRYSDLILSPSKYLVPLGFGILSTERVRKVLLLSFYTSMPKFVCTFRLCK